MRRVEIIVNQSIEADLFESFSSRGVASHYTKIPGAHGVGNSDPKMGDHIWPEENVVLIIYCKKEEAALIEDAVKDVKKRFPSEGLKIFSMKY
ncbi:MAG: hypothetical protein PQJ58_05150 [Spirochaetales bacterium]|nr:hypothetical protein [Spirochaetales bacterium]